MTAIKTNNISVPRIARNKRIYAGNTAVTNIATSTASGLHIEKGTIYATSRNIDVDFASQFKTVPVGWIKVYRIREIMTGKFKQQDVLFYHETFHTSSVVKDAKGFSLTIDDREDFNGVIIEYFFI